MLPAGQYIHDIDPIIGTIFGIHLWWYGLSYTLGFFNAVNFIKKRRGSLFLSDSQVYDLGILIAAGVVVGGRAVEVIFYESAFYSENLALIPALWLGGMASHGLLVGGLAAVWIFCRISGKPFLTMTDVLAPPASFILGMGRIGNFIDGQILGSVTNVPWAVKFPDADGFRHPVVVYDGIKNLLIIPVLLFFFRRNVRPGVVTGLFLFLYSFLRIPVDVFREYPTSLLGLATGQALNIAFSLVGILVIVYSLRRRRSSEIETLPVSESVCDLRWRKRVFNSILVFCLIIPSDWTQDISARYGRRHPGLVRSSIYPKIVSVQEDPAQ
ncbi:MAG TPA: prolipoprotein diacylglyceryl transferase [Pyrinomonadaceae bacterium]|nr:prolipoprotein diacylglyceryl transferase [Pyrinomonadaceae bacterium]